MNSVHAVHVAAQGVHTRLLRHGHRWTFGSGTPPPCQHDAFTATVTLVAAEAGPLRVAVYDVLGRRVAVLHDGPLAAGEHALTLDTASLPAGVYVVRASGGAFSATQRVTVVR